MRLTAALAAAAVIATAAITPGADAATQGYSLTPFTGIRVEAPLRLVVRTGRGTSASAEGDRRTLDRLQLTVNGDTLRVRLAPPSGGSGGPSQPGGPVTISVTTGQLSRILVTGSATVEIDRMAGERGAIDMAGAGKVTVAAMALDRLALTLSGSGAAKLAGSAKLSAIGLIGAGTIDAAALTSGELTITAEGTGSAAFAATGSADIRALGAGDVTVTGKAACKVDHKGSGRVMCGGKEW